MSSLGSIALGPEGNIWFVDVYKNVVGRITAAGAISQFAVPLDMNGGAQTIAAGPDGDLWVLGREHVGNNNWIVRVSPTGEVAKIASISSAVDSITAGPDGAMWFTEVSAGSIGRVTTTGHVTEFPLPTRDSAPRGITTGPDGNLWFAESERTHVAVGKITTSGRATEYAVGVSPSDQGPSDLIAGPDGNLWFTEGGSGGIGHISVSGGDFTQVPLPNGSRPSELAAGPDGNIWFTDEGKNSIARMSVVGVLREFPMPRRGVSPYGIAVGGDRRIWITESFAPSLASIGTKVPEMLLSSRVLNFVGAQAITEKVTNTGDAALLISSTTFAGADAGLFSVKPGNCSGSSIAPGSSCEIEVVHSAGGDRGLQSALMRITDNATGSPQLVSLVANTAVCQLPIVVSVADGAAQGELLDVSSGRALYEPRGGFTTSTDASGARTTVLTTTQPVLTGVSSGFFDRAVGRWLPVPDGRYVSPDGSRYVYVQSDLTSSGPQWAVHLVDVATGADRVVPTPPGPWAVVAFTDRGIYLHQAYEGIGPGLYLVDPDAGTFTQVLAQSTVADVTGDEAWVETRNPADTQPGPPGMGPNFDEIVRQNLATHAVTSWLYVPGTAMWLVAAPGGAPVVSIYDGTATTYSLVPSAGDRVPITVPFTTDQYPDLSGFVADTYGIWIGSPDGVYLWTARTGAALISDVAATPAGTCA